MNTEHSFCKVLVCLSDNEKQFLFGWGWQKGRIYFVLVNSSVDIVYRLNQS